MNSNNLVLYVIIFFISYVSTIKLVPPLIRSSAKRGWVDQPGKRKVHNIPVPRIGGVAFIVPFIIIYLLSWIIGIKLKWVDHEANTKLLSIAVSTSIIILAGFLDDTRGLRVRYKLSAQIIASLILINSGIFIEFFLPYKFLMYLITVIWIVGITNSFNLMDNMDGLSSGVAFIGCMIFFFLGILRGVRPLLTMCAVLLAGGLLGFLKYNSHPAKIFMGDVGSLFIGFIMATMSVGATYLVESRQNFPILTPLFILAVPIFDTLSVIIIRVYNKKPIHRGDMNHFSHRLVKLGMTQKHAVYFIYLVTFLIGVDSIFLPELNITEVVFLFMQTAGIFGIIALLIQVGIKYPNNSENEKVSAGKNE